MRKNLLLFSHLCLARFGNPASGDVELSARSGKKETALCHIQDGFTIVEVMVAVLLLSVFIGGALELLSQTMRTHYLVRDRTEATNLAWSRVERASNVEFSALMDLVEAGTRINRAGLPDDEGEFLRNTTVTPLSGALSAVQIRVEVFHRNRRTGQFSGSPEVIETVLSNIARIPEEGL